MSIVEQARTLESRIARALNRAAVDAVGASEREGLETIHAIVDAVERQVQPGSRGTRLFPFNHVAVTMLAPSREARLRFDALAAAPPSLRERMCQRLRAAGCVVDDLRVDVDYATKPGRAWSDPQFHVALDQVAVEPVAEAPPAELSAPPMAVELTVVRGTAEPQTSTFALPRIDIGRGAEVRDSRQHLVRSNHLAFVEGAAGANQTVSRCHAHVAVDSASRTARLHDDRSAQGTGIVRGGRTIPVPQGARGVRLRSGDEIVLGEARVRVRLEETEDSNRRERGER